MSVRRIKANTRSLTGHHFGLKAGKLVPFESSLELDFMYRLDIDADVLWYESQPVTINFVDKFKKVRHYTPDFLIHYASRWLLAEVKFLADLDDKREELQPGLAAGGAYAEEQLARLRSFDRVPDSGPRC